MCRKPGENIWWWFKLRKKSDYGGALKKVRCENFVTRDVINSCARFMVQSLYVLCNVEFNLMCASSGTILNIDQVGRSVSDFDWAKDDFYSKFAEKKSKIRVKCLELG